MDEIIKWVEDTLIKDGTFSLPGKKALYGDEIEYEIVLIDATESPIERPKKNKDTSIQEKEKTYIKITSGSTKIFKENNMYYLYKWQDS